MNYGHNDLTPQEVEAGLKSTPLKLSAYVTRVGAPEYPKKLDYRKFQVGKTIFSRTNLVMPVQNQGKCGSCYMYAALGQMASFLALQHKKPIFINPAPFLHNAVSSTPLVEDPSAPCSPCSGNNSYRVLKNMVKQSLSGNDMYILSNPLFRNLTHPIFPPLLSCGIQACSDDASKKRTCENLFVTPVPVTLDALLSTVPGTAKPQIQIPKFTHLGLVTFPSCPVDAEKMLISVLNMHGPVVLFIYMKAAASALEAPYIYDESMIPSDMVEGYFSNHEVLCIGYKKVNDKQVWILQNCWGTDWGDSGIFYLPRGISREDLGGWSVSQWQEWPKGPGNIFGTEYQIYDAAAHTTITVKQNKTLSILYTADEHKRSCQGDGYFKNPYSQPPDCTCEVGYTAPDCVSCVNAEMDPAEGCDYCKKGLGFQGPACNACKIGFEGADCAACVNKKLQFPFCDIACPNARQAPPMCDTCLGNWTGPKCDTCSSQYDAKTCAVCRNQLLDEQAHCTRCKDPNADFAAGCKTCASSRMILSDDLCTCKIPFAMKIDDQCKCGDKYMGPMCNLCMNGNSFPDC